MPDENELEELTNKFLDDMITMKGVDFSGRKAESSKVMGIMAECGKSDCVSGKNICET